MTQFFTYEGFALWKAPLQIRVLVTTFVLVATLGVAVGIVNYQVRTGLTAEGSAAWYRGTASGAGGSAPDPAERGGDAGPTNADGTPAGQGPLYEKSPLELLDATHPHLFNQAFLFFVLGHLLALCSVPSGLKIGVYLGGFSGVLVDTASPWLIRYVSPEFAHLQLAGHVVMAAAFTALVAIPLREMWGRRARRARSGAGPGRPGGAR